MKDKIKNKYFIIVVLSIVNLMATAQVKIIPHPQKVTELKGRLEISSLRCYYTQESKNEVLYLGKRLAEDFNMTLEFSTVQRSANLKLVIEERKWLRLGREGYKLVVSSQGVKIYAGAPAGVFYGIQSMLQMMRKERDGSFSIPHVEIEDTPRFEWRAFMLDEARRFKGVVVVKQMLDEMAYLKMNTFHWHLTDDQGWRVEIKKYPELIKTGAHRKGSKVSPGDVSDGIPHSGYYTQDDIREIVSYAAARHIKVIPEIEMPGHASAAIASYPWLGAKNKQIEIPEALLAIYKDIYNVADPGVRAFIKDVIDEIIPLFPSKIIHIGGDEVKYDQWKASPMANEFMKTNNLQSPADLHLWFTNHMSSYISDKGYRMMGWNDITGNKIHDYIASEDLKLGTDLDSRTIVQFWKGDPKLIEETVKKGYDIVNSYHVYTYLDYSHESISLEKAYSFDPIPDTLDPIYHNKILGLGCQMWSQAIPTVESMHQQIFPRLAAYAEIGWTTKKHRNFQRFKESLPALKKAWDQRQIKYTQTEQIKKPD
ncbi:beta-N-acetylhexosaminidase [Seonamhaeicola sp.]|uniref:beta-N-acetylhexosaminidase n=1 Tax=Seonamhaeicola sp. TaxID=1912245 RepID=UPI00261087C5|nr:beta-N-acetylhexosaminidase [Seonamhaeicola sp.]